MKQTNKINTGFITQEAENKISLFDPDQSILFTLNETASFIFQQIKKGYTNERIIKNLIKNYSITQDTAEKDLKDILKLLETKHIILKNE